MEFFYISFLTCVFFVTLCFAFKSVGVKLLGNKAHPFVLFIIIQFCILSLPGVFLISFFGFDSKRYLGIPDLVKVNVGLWYIYSIIVLFIVLVLLFRHGRCNWYQKLVAEEIDNRKGNDLFFIILIISVLLFILKVSLSKAAPLWYLVLGDVRTAYLVRVDMQLHHEKYYIPYVSKFVSQYLVYQFYFCLYYFVFSIKRSRLIFIGLFLSFLMAAIECLYDTQKAPFIFLLIGCLFIIYLKKQNLLKITIPIASVFIVLVILQSIISGSDLNVGISHAVDRFILGQNQGFYHIINSINPDSKYWFNGFYFIKQLGVDVSRADVDVLPYTIYKNSDIVNVNSYYLGEAWSMFGTFGLLVSPFIVGIMTFLYVKLIDLLIGNEPLMTIPFMIYFIPSISVQQSFNYFLYSKSFALSMVLFIATIMIIKSVHFVVKFLR